jgi:hypothetical protein
MSYRVYEGVIETDWWHGTLLSVIHIIEPNKAIFFNRSTPMFHAVPVCRELIDKRAFDVNITAKLEDLPERLWNLYLNSVKPAADASTGRYLKQAKQKEKNKISEGKKHA